MDPPRLGLGLGLRLGLGSWLGLGLGLGLAHPNPNPPSAVVAGGRRQPKPAFEWQRDEIRDPDEPSAAAPVRVACKSAQLLWDSTSKCGRPKPTRAVAVLPRREGRPRATHRHARTHA